MSKMKLALDVIQDLRNLADSLEALANTAGSGDLSTLDQPAATHGSAEPQQKHPEAPKLTLVELRAFVAEKSTPGNRTKIKAILEKYGVKKLTELPEAHYPALMREVEAL